MATKVKPLSASKQPDIHPSQDPANNTDQLQQFQLPADIQAILGADYELPQISDDEEIDDGGNDEEITLEIASKPLITQKVDEALPVPDHPILNEATVEDYLKNTLSQLNLVRTLNQFQSEWLELAARADRGFMPGASQFQSRDTSQLLAENLRLKFELDQMRLQNEKVVQAATKAKEQFIKLRRQRDFHRTKHRQAVQERASLVNDLRRLREHCQLYQPLILELNQRYDKLMKNKQISDLARDKAVNEARKLQMALSVQRGDTEEAAGASALNKSQLQPPKRTLAGTAVEPLQRTYHINEQSWENPFLEGDESPLKFTAMFQMGTQSKAHDGAISSVAFHMSKQVIATGSADGSFKVFTTPAAQQSSQLLIRGQPHSSFITSCRFNPAGNYGSILASCAGDGTVKLFDVSAQAELGDLCSMGTQSATVGLDGITLKKGQLNNAQAGLPAAWSLDWHCGGNILALGCADKAVRLFDVNVGKAIRALEQGALVSFPPYHSFRGASRAIQSVDFQYFGNLLAASGADGVTKVYDARAHGVVSSVTLKAAAVSAFDLTGNLLACADLDGQLVIQDLRNSKYIGKYEIGKPTTCLSFGGSDELLIGTKNGLFCVKQGALKPVDKTEGISFESCDFNTMDGGYACGSADGVLYYLK